MSISIAAAIGLFLLRKWAAKLFWAALILNVVMIGLDTIANDPRRSLRQSITVGRIMEVGAQLAICLYSNKLTKAGILR
jgi:hypothetical protein